jgi:hypothetical protein
VREAESAIRGIVREIIVALRVIEQISRITLARAGPMTACRVCVFPIAIEPMKRVAWRKRPGRCDEE